MALPIGATFAVELTAAGVALDGLAWDPATGLVTAVDGDDHLAAVEAVLAKHDPTKMLPRTASAKQVRYAVTDLGVRTAWTAAVAASSQGGQDYWTSADPMVEDNAKISRWCAAVGITPRALFDKAVTE